MEDHDVRLAHAELLCLSRIMSSVNGSPYPVALVGGSLSVVICLNSSRDVGMVFVPYRAFISSVLLKCVQQAHQDVFGMLDIISVMDYSMVRLRTAPSGLMDTLLFSVVFELGKCHLMISVEPIQQFVRCSGSAHPEEKRDTVGCFVDVLVTFRVWWGLYFGAVYVLLIVSFVFRLAVLIG